MPRHDAISAIAGCRYSRQIVSIGLGTAVSSAANPTSLSVPYPTAQGSVAADTITYLAIALKPGTANLGAVATPSGWTLTADHIGGGYGGTLGDATGNSRVYLFHKENENTNTGSLAVAITPNGANAVAAANMGRIQKLKRSWQTIVVSKAEATADVIAGVYTPSPDLIVSPGDMLIYAFGIGNFYTGGSAGLSAGAGLTTWSPSLASGSVTASGHDIGEVSTARRAQRGLTLGAQTLTLPSGVCRGPMVVARFRVR